jgi:uncharacterized membrane protein YphA (DoxX/SURF4 family)
MTDRNNNEPVLSDGHISPKTGPATGNDNNSTTHSRVEKFKQYFKTTDVRTPLYPYGLAIIIPVLTGLVIAIAHLTSPYQVLGLGSVMLGGFILFITHHPNGSLYNSPVNKKLFYTLYALMFIIVGLVYLSVGYLIPDLLQPLR